MPAIPNGGLVAAAIGAVGMVSAAVYAYRASRFATVQNRASGTEKNLYDRVATLERSRDEMLQSFERAGAEHRAEMESARVSHAAEMAEARKMHGEEVGRLNVQLHMQEEEVTALRELNSTLKQENWLLKHREPIGADEVGGGGAAWTS